MKHAFLFLGGLESEFTLINFIVLYLFSIFGVRILIPNLLELSSKRLLPSDNNGEVIFVFDDFNLSLRNPRLHVVTTLNWDQHIICAMKYGDLALYFILHLFQILFHFCSTPTNHIV